MIKKTYKAGDKLKVIKSFDRPGNKHFSEKTVLKNQIIKINENIYPVDEVLIECLCYNHKKQNIEENSLIFCTPESLDTHTEPIREATKGDIFVYNQHCDEYFLEENTEHMVGLIGLVVDVTEDYVAYERQISPNEQIANIELPNNLCYGHHVHNTFLKITDHVFNVYNYLKK